MFWFEALQAGLYGALASVCGKLSTSTEWDHLVIKKILLTTREATGMSLGFKDSLIDEYFQPFLRLIFFIGIFVCNALMWSKYTKSLVQSSSSAQAEGVTKGMNLVWTVE